MGVRELIEFLKQRHSKSPYGIVGGDHLRRCLRCNQIVHTTAPTILCDGVVAKVVPLSKHEPVG